MTFACTSATPFYVDFMFKKYVIIWSALQFFAIHSSDNWNGINNRSQPRSGLSKERHDNISSTPDNRA